MRILLDTNILARAATPNPGPARALLLKATEDPHVLVLSGYVLAELGRILRYERVRPLHGLTDSGIDQYLADLQAVGVTRELPNEPVAQIVPHDPGDDGSIATAIAGQADILCTRDRHFHHPVVRAHCESRGIRVLTDPELLELLRDQSGTRNAK